jgi:myo-inositol-1(or 4)-monophosphatase
MGDSEPVTYADWLSLCRRACESIAVMLAERSTTAQRAVETGTRGSGGDHTLEIDEAAEAIVFAELGALHREGFTFVAVSEERGEVDFGSDAVRVVIDPIDGSLNAKRGIAHHALSLAVAAGETMADVEFGYVNDLGTAEEWWAAMDEGAFLNDKRLDRDVAEQRGPDGRIEVVGIESADPRWLKGSIDVLVERA